MKTKEENKNKKGLGRGISSLLGEVSSANSQKVEKSTKTEVDTDEMRQEVAHQNRIWYVAIEKLKPSPFQPRQVFKKEELDELSNSIKQKGILQPIVARKDGDAFEIIAGERRWRAAQIAGLHEVPVILKTYDDLEALELAIIENVQRADLNPIEEAEAYHRLSTQFDLSQAQIAEKVGKDRATIANALRLLQLPKIVREMVQNNQISQGHAKVLLGLSDEERLIQLAKKCANEGLSVRKLESLVKTMQNSEANSESQDNATIQAIHNIEEKLSKRLNTKVSIRYRDGKGHLTIHFYQKDQFGEIIERLLNK
jgi:ParB family chromosome partitioning protein